MGVGIKLYSLQTEIKSIAVTDQKGPERPRFSRNVSSRAVLGETPPSPVQPLEQQLSCQRGGEKKKKKRKKTNQRRNPFKLEIHCLKFLRGFFLCEEHISEETLSRFHCSEPSAGPSSPSRMGGLLPEGGGCFLSSHPSFSTLKRSVTVAGAMTVFAWISNYAWSF